MDKTNLGYTPIVDVASAASTESVDIYSRRPHEFFIHAQEKTVVDWSTAVQNQCFGGQIREFSAGNSAGMVVTIVKLPLTGDSAGSSVHTQ